MLTKLVFPFAKICTQMETTLGVRLQALVASVALVLSASVASAQSAGSAMLVGGATTQPVGHYEFCQSHRSECGRMARANPVTLDALAWAQLNAVNRQVNSAVRGLTDLQIYGRNEVWTYPTNLGDCEDYALLKRQLLIAAGWPPSSLLITMVLRPSGDAHAVLTVRTDHGDYILDNLRPEVALWSEVPYLFVKRQSERDAGAWVIIQGGANVAGVTTPPQGGNVGVLGQIAGQAYGGAINAFGIVQ
jgi:predicted transglutaminase-like cysteine proteinase